MYWLLIFSICCSSLLAGLSEPSTHGSGAAPANVVPAATPENAKCKPCVRPGYQPNASPNVTDIMLNKTELRLPCPDGSTEQSPSELTIDVETSAEDDDGDVLIYVYSVSGGRVAGTGKKVYWNFLDVKPGEHQIMAAVDDGCGICGRTMKKTVSVVGCTPSE